MELLKVTQEALHGLTNAKRNDLAERETWETTVDAAVKASMDRGLEMLTEGIYGMLDKRFDKQLQEAEVERQRAADLLLGETDPNRGEQLHAAVNLLSQQKKEIEGLKKILNDNQKNLEEIKQDDITNSNVSTQEKLKQILEKGYDGLSKVLNDPKFIKLVKIGKIPGEFAVQSKRIVDSSYDITSECLAWSRLNRLNKDSEEYYKKIEKLSNRITIIVELTEGRATIIRQRTISVYPMK